MKINLNEIDLENFLVNKSMIAGETVFLVIPNHIGCAWTKDNLHFRSSVWNSQGELISASWKKFFNLTEKPNLVPDPTDIADLTLIEKIDGSLLCVSKYKSQLITRTRGTFDAHGLDNGDEIEELKKMYPRAFDNILLNEENHSLIFEWVTPRNKIVLDYGGLDIYMLGVICHTDYSYLTNDLVDGIAQEIGVKRPKRYSFKSMDEMLESVKAFKGVEGVVAYFDNDQQMKKIKGLSYLALHRFKSNCNEENIVDMFFSCGKPTTTEEFLKHIETTFDFESAQMASNIAIKVVETYNEMVIILSEMRQFVNNIDPTSDRKQKAGLIIAKYKAQGLQGFAFTVLDGKPLDEKKLLFQLLEKKQP